MSDFFAGIHNIAQPDVVMNSGPLPPTNTGSGHPGFDGTPDGKINVASSLLGEMQPYAYGHGDRPGTQAAYLNIPHIVQRIVPEFKLPEPDNCSKTAFFFVSHGVCDGDVAFVVRTAHSAFPLITNRNRIARQGRLHAVDVLVNLQTANYMLHGLQYYVRKSNAEPKWECPNWAQLYIALGLPSYFASAADAGAKMELFVSIITQQLIRPFGIPKGSDMQGGQHQGVNGGAVTWPVDHVISMVVDGRSTNLLNFWRDPKSDVKAGDDLVFAVKPMDNVHYSLSSNLNSHQERTFIESTHIPYQFVPVVMNPGDDLGCGYWHIARSEIQLLSHNTSRLTDVCTSATAMCNGKLIDCTFEPVYYPRRAADPSAAPGSVGPSTVRMASAMPAAAPVMASAAPVVVQTLEPPKPKRKPTPKATEGGSIFP
jgi:hypothetical protein